jgi:hypothetical protein
LGSAVLSRSTGNLPKSRAKALRSWPRTVRERLTAPPCGFGTLKAWIGATLFKTRTLGKVGTEMSLKVLAYNLKRVIAILGAETLMTRA